MRPPTLFRVCTLCTFLALVFSHPCLGEPAPGPAADGSAEIRTLRATVDRQAKEILSLRAELAALRAGKPLPATTRPAATIPAATQPVAQARQPQRVIFVIDVGSLASAARPMVAAEVARAIDELAPDDLFDVVYFSSTEKDAQTFRRRPVPPTQINRRACFDEISRIPTNGMPGDLAVGLRAAMKMEPTTVWVLTSDVLRVKPADLLREIKTLNAPQRTGLPPATINTVLTHGRETEFLWSLAHESNGVFIDLDGHELHRPPPPATAPKEPPPLPTGPSIRTPHPRGS